MKRIIILFGALASLFICILFSAYSASQKDTLLEINISNSGTRFDNRKLPIDNCHFVIKGNYVPSGDKSNISTANFFFTQLDIPGHQISTNDGDYAVSIFYGEAMPYVHITGYVYDAALIAETISPIINIYNDIHNQWCLVQISQDDVSEYFFASNTEGMDMTEVMTIIK